MQERNGDADSHQALEEAGRSSVEMEIGRLLEETGGKAVYPDAARRGIKSSMSEFYEIRRRWAAQRESNSNEETPVEVPEDTEAEAPTDLEMVAEEEPRVVEGQVMGGIVIKELEMMPKIEAMRQLEEIPVGGTTNIEAEVIGAIAGVAAQSVEGVASLGSTSFRRTIRERMGGGEKRGRGVGVEAGSREVVLDINVRVIYGYSIPMIVVKVRETVADRLLRFCGLVAKEINIRVIGIEFPARAPGRVQ